MYVAAGDLRIATLHVRSSLPPAEAARTIRRVVRDVEPRLSAEDIETTDMVIDGLASGLGLYLWASRYLEARLFGVSALDARVLVGASAILIVAALTAAWFPARRATRVDPTIALRAE